MSHKSILATARFAALAAPPPPPPPRITLDGQRAWAIRRAECLRDAVASGDLLPIHAHTLAVQIANGVDAAEDDLNAFKEQTTWH